MERLTTYKTECNREMICRYEDCDVCEEYCPHLQEDNCSCLKEILEKLGAYEDAEEQGLLLRLPCKVGDTVYIGGMLGCSEIDEWEITNITMRWGENDEPYFYADLKRAKRNNCSFWMKEFGRSVFLTREEAEKALEDMKGGKE